MPGKVPNRIRDQRSHLLHDIGSRLRKQFYESQQGKERVAIFEQLAKNGEMTGFTDNYVEIRTPADSGFLHRAGLVQIGVPENNGSVSARLISMKPLT
jgi:tRNA A37 methylthiotransferase MiaB